MSGITLDVLYARLPSIECKGLCFAACGPIPCTKGEAQRMENLSGAPLTYNAEGFCGYLKDQRCSVYEARPMICRLFGLTPKLACPFGCKPSRVMYDPECHAALVQARKIGGAEVFAELSP